MVPSRGHSQGEGPAAGMSLDAPEEERGGGLGLSGCRESGRRGGPETGAGRSCRPVSHDKKSGF